MILFGKSYFFFFLGCDYKIKNTNTRLVYCYIFFMCFLMFNYYGASLASIRIGGSIMRFNDSLKELTLLHFKMSSEKMVYFYFLMKVRFHHKKSDKNYTSVCVITRIFEMKHFVYTN